MKKCAFYFITYFVVCFCGLGILYWLVSLLTGEPALPWVLSGWNYQDQYPMQYIGAVAICYAAVASLWTAWMKRRRMGVLRVLEALAVILVALVLACPFCGMLWHFHDMLKGFFPDFWLQKLLGGFVDGLIIGPRLIFYSSFPSQYDLIVPSIYNSIALTVGYFVTTCLNSFLYRRGDGDKKGGCAAKQKGAAS